MVAGSERLWYPIIIQVWAASIASTILSPCATDPAIGFSVRTGLPWRSSSGISVPWRVMRTGALPI